MPLHFLNGTGGTSSSSGIPVGALTLGSGLTGSLSGSTLLIAVTASDTSIVVTAAGISLGAITDAIHGARGGDGLHTVATSTTAGFMSSADKIKLDGYPSASNFGSPLFPSIITATTTIPAGTTTLAANSYNQILIVSGTLVTANYVVYASERIEVVAGGIIRNNGSNGATGAAGGAGGAAIAIGSWGAATIAGTTGNNAGAGPAGNNVANALGGNGGKGGTSGSTAAGAGGVITAPVASRGGSDIVSLPFMAYFNQAAFAGGNSSLVLNYGASGAGGSGGTNSRGGGGGGGAGAVCIVSPVIIVSGTVQACGGIGGDGQAAGNAHGGGGGGGGGGAIYFFGRTILTGSAVLEVTGGLGGQPAGVNATTGTRGDNGTVIKAYYF